MKYLLSAFTLLSSVAYFAQAQNPVTWKTNYTRSGEAGVITITAAIEKGWHMYSQRATDAGPVPTSFTFTPSKNYQLDGKTIESETHEEFDQAFDAKLFSFTDKAEFSQKIKLNANAGFNIPIKVEFMVCNDRMCLPPRTVELSVRTQ